MIHCDPFDTQRRHDPIGYARFTSVNHRHQEHRRLPVFIQQRGRKIRSAAANADCKSLKILASSLIGPENLRGVQHERRRRFLKRDDPRIKIAAVRQRH